MTGRAVLTRADASTPVSAEGPHGPIRLKWHRLRTRQSDAPFRRENLALGWRLGASLEIDVQASADRRLVVAHDPTLGPSTTGRGRVGRTPLAVMAGLFHRDPAGVADPDAPVLSLADLVAPLRSQRPAAGSNLQLDLILPKGRPLTEAGIGDAVTAVAGLERAIVVGSYHLDPARRLVAAIPGARLGYDPTLAAPPGPKGLLRHLARRRAGIAVAYLRFAVVAEAEAEGFPLVRRLLDLGIETDVWTVNPGPGVSDTVLSRLIEAGVRQITTDAPDELARRIADLGASRQP
jgi:glycerophosphoryl diester phosphodiesterase